MEEEKQRFKKRINTKIIGCRRRKVRVIRMF
jgi:hypothetical protein